MGEMQTQFFGLKPQGQETTWEMCVDRIIVKWIYTKLSKKTRTRFTWLRTGPNGRLL
jgi:hypothetical protein